MSVTKPYRTESSIQFIEEVYQLNVKLGTAYVRMPTKYRQPYGEKMAECALEALEHLQIGNGIYLSKDTSEELFNARQCHFNEAKGIIYHVCTLYQIYLRIRRTVESPKKQDADKWINQGKTIADACNRCIDLIGGVIISDKKRYKAFKK